MVEELKQLKVLLYSKLLHKDLLKKLYFRGLVPRGLMFSKEELKGQTNADPPKEKKKKEKKRRIFLSFSPTASCEAVAVKATIAETLEQKER
ncbi:hypothetical protein COCNU_11G003720 [Cocos nucifera]|uniref:Uncharacterized protein n=1 Tax=Cocos nucifera TaxID=13894 RepID=A0A8K0N9R6_COCNU|nr:hypothetical protein COCNU_11G003720 [Cocos nucifera]